MNGKLLNILEELAYEKSYNPLIHIDGVYILLNLNDFWHEKILQEIHLNTMPTVFDKESVDFSTIQIMGVKITFMKNGKLGAAKEDTSRFFELIYEALP